tara:strand:- start:841 stop:1260 length:420 start_codon:yes stop_codon:yes gene_type:complete
MIISSVPKEVVDFVWQDVCKVLHKSVETSGGKFTMDDIYDGVVNDMYGLWIVMENKKVIAAITTRIIEYPGKRGMAMDWIGGTRMLEWLPMAQRTLQKFAKENNCTHLEGYGRKAWSKVLKKYNWQPEYIAYRMELNNG